MESKVLTIPEFAEAAGIKKQGIYEQVKNSNSKLYPYFVFKGKKTYIKFEALEEIYGIFPVESKDNQDNSQEKQAQKQDSKDDSQDRQDEKQDSQGDSQEPKQENQGASQGTEQGIIEFLQEQIRGKDRQIEERDKQITGLLQMLAYEQQAHQKTLLQLEEARGNTTAEAEEQEPIEEEKKQEEAPAEEKKNLSWWQRFINWWSIE